MHRPTPRDWLLLATGSTYKFTLTGFYFVTLFAVLKQQNYDLNRLSWLKLIGGIEAGKVLFAALMERRVSERFGRFRLWLLGATAVLTATFILMSDSSSGPMSETVARTGWPCLPKTSQSVTGKPVNCGVGRPNQG